MKLLRKVWLDERGEDLTEYALITGLVALAVVVGAGFLGGAFNTWYTKLSDYVGTIAAPAV